jgi:hypothetical protein
VFTARYELSAEIQYRFFVYNGRAMAQAVSRWPLTAETRLRFHVRSVVYKVTLGQGFIRIFRFSLVSIIPLILYIRLSLRVVVTKQTNGRSLGTFQKGMLFRKPGSMGYKNISTLSLKGYIIFLGEPLTT